MSSASMVAVFVVAVLWVANAQEQVALTESWEAQVDSLVEETKSLVEEGLSLIQKSATYVKRSTVRQPKAQARAAAVRASLDKQWNSRLKSSLLALSAYLKTHQLRIDALFKDTGFNPNSDQLLNAKEIHNIVSGVDQKTKSLTQSGILFNMNDAGTLVSELDINKDKQIDIFELENAMLGMHQNKEPLVDSELKVDPEVGAMLLEEASAEAMPSDPRMRRSTATHSSVMLGLPAMPATASHLEEEANELEAALWEETSAEAISFMQTETHMRRSAPASKAHAAVDSDGNIRVDSEQRPSQESIKGFVVSAEGSLSLS